MKRLVKIFAVVSVFASLVACQKYADYNLVPFTSLDTDGMKVSENADGVTVSLPVHLYNASEGCSVAYDIVDITAKQGLDYTVVDGSGVLNFNAGETSKDITFRIVGQPGTYTGNTKFNVVLKSATNDVTLGSINTCTVTIADLDHPLTALFGTYEYKSYQLYTDGSLGYYKWSTMTISPDEEETFKVWLDKVFLIQLLYPTYLAGDGGKLYANVTPDMKTITIPVPQDFYTNGENLFGEEGEWYVFKCDGLDFTTKSGVITFTLQDDGSYVSYDDFGLNTYEYQETAPGDWYYYGMNALPSLDPTKPTRFIKID